MDKTTIDEYLLSVPGFGQLAAPAQIPYLVFFLTEVSGGVATPKSVTELRTSLRLAEYARVPAHLSECTKRVGERPVFYVKVACGYALERHLAEKIRTQTTGRRTARATAREIRKLLATVADPGVRSYVEEAVGCFEDGHFRAAIVFTWCAAYSVFRLWLYDKKLVPLNAQMAAWKKPKHVSVIDDFQELQESVVIDTSRTAKIISKEQEKLLTKLLDERNSFAHASAITASSSIAEAFIERAIRDVINVYV